MALKQYRKYQKEYDAAMEYFFHDAPSVLEAEPSDEKFEKLDQLLKEANSAKKLINALLNIPDRVEFSDAGKLDFTKNVGNAGQYVVLLGWAILKDKFSKEDNLILKREQWEDLAWIRKTIVWKQRTWFEMN